MIWYQDENIHRGTLLPVLATHYTAPAVICQLLHWWFLTERLKMYYQLYRKGKIGYQMLYIDVYSGDQKT